MNEQNYIKGDQKGVTIYPLWIEGFIKNYIYKHFQQKLGKPGQDSERMRVNIKSVVEKELLDLNLEKLNNIKNKS